ncbi:Homoprotocatechuate catabolism bifunctional isomerase/decarboxylase [bioreactor metagenome]|uniref:Homoprotocatechuate catabolism bifunctional isomerase/decarboxylase n=1 Tax=bioreactor metagenome TaxID=1076179 RepID=A0A645DBD5_9ZZZZ
MNTQPPPSQGTVYGVLLNDRATVDRLAPQFSEPPYKAAPKAPVLYIKPRNTYASDGATVPIPHDPGAVSVEATLGLVIGATARRVSREQAMAHVSGFIIASDLTLPHDNYYRPAIRQRCRDAFCPMSRTFAASSGFDIDRAELEITIHHGAGHPSTHYRRSFADLVRSAPVLLADVTEFMTLSPGDVLLLGPGDGSPLARAGDAVLINVPGLGQLRHTLVAEIAASLAGAHA